MKTGLMISGALLTGTATAAGQYGAAAAIGMGHILLYMLHVIEVKLNKLLDDRGIYLMPKDFD